ncbi:MAG: cytidylate kinase-like family protein [Deltaproteobacteria bacterium]|nr:cytidylate kinase-like family protein [Deltaproteobacteria bacterium]
MAIVTISRGSHSRGGQVAERVAARLGYECIAREILLEASDHYDIPEARLVHSVKDAPTILDRITGGRRRYVTTIQAALLKHLRRDDVVYHGLAGQVFVADLAHVLKVRVVADPDDRLDIVMQRDGVSRAQAAAVLEHDDSERRRWAQKLYGVDPADPCLYDLVIHIHKLSVEDAASLICASVSLPQFRSTQESAQLIDDLALAADVQAALMDLTVDIEVTAHRGEVTITTIDHLARVPSAVRPLEGRAWTVPGVTSVRVVPGLLSTPPPAPIFGSRTGPPSSRRMIA